MTCLTGVVAFFCAFIWTMAVEETSIHPDEDKFIPFNGERFDAFDWLLCKAVDSREPGNLVISPIGVKLVLAMLYEGAAGTTAQQLRQILQLPSPKYQSRNKFSNILRSLQMTRSEYVLDIGSKMYINQDVTVKDRFIRILNIFYNTDVDKVNFENPKQTVSFINEWVNGMTHGNIEDMVTENELTPSTTLLLLNAIYFKGLWRHPFSPNSTVPGHFYLTPQKTITVDYMIAQNYFYFLESHTLDAKILRMPYMGKKFSMFLILPNKKDGLEHLLRTVTPSDIKTNLKQMISEDVDVVLPKFRFDFTSHLRNVLEQIGIKEIFEDDANLQGITLGYNNKLSVSTVLQKAGLEVNEHGTTAWGATEVNLPNKIGSSYEFHATHPFMFFIEDENTGTVIFVGKVVHPTVSKKHTQLGSEKPNENTPLYPLPLSTFSSVFPQQPKKPKSTKKPPTVEEEGGISAVGIVEEPIGDASDYNLRFLAPRVGGFQKPGVNNFLQEKPALQAPSYQTGKIDPKLDTVSFPESNIIWDHLRNRWYEASN